MVSVPWCPVWTSPYIQFDQVRMFWMICSCPEKLSSHTIMSLFFVAFFSNNLSTAQNIKSVIQSNDCFCLKKSTNCSKYQIRSFPEKTAFVFKNLSTTQNIKKGNCPKTPFVFTNLSTDQNIKSGNCPKTFTTRQFHIH